MLNHYSCALLGFGSNISNIAKFIDYQMLANIPIIKLKQLVS